MLNYHSIHSLIHSLFKSLLTLNVETFPLGRDLLLCKWTSNHYSVLQVQHLLPQMVPCGVILSDSCEKPSQTSTKTKLPFVNCWSLPAAALKWKMLINSWNWFKKVSLSDGEATKCLALWHIFAVRDDCRWLSMLSYAQGWSMKVLV